MCVGGRKRKTESRGRLRRKRGRECVEEGGREKERVEEGGGEGESVHSREKEYEREGE